MMSKIRDWLRQRKIEKDAKRFQRYRDADFAKMKSHYAELLKKFKAEQAKAAEDRQELETRIAVLEHDKDKLTRQLELAAMEIEGLAEIVNRDRKRVEAETAIEVRKIEMAVNRIVDREE